MELIIFEFDETNVLKQQVRAKSEINLVSVRPHIYLEGNPTGDLIVDIQDMNGSSLAVSDRLDLSVVTTKAIFHGYVNMKIALTMKQDASYNICLKAIDLAGGIIGWANDLSMPCTSNDVVMSSPLDIELWSNNNVFFYDTDIQYRSKSGGNNANSIRFFDAAISQRASG